MILSIIFPLNIKAETSAYDGSSITMKYGGKLHEHIVMPNLDYNNPNGGASETRTMWSFLFDSASETNNIGFCMDAVYSVRAGKAYYFERELDRRKDADMYRIFNYAYQNQGNKTAQIRTQIAVWSYFYKDRGAPEMWTSSNTLITYTEYYYSLLLERILYSTTAANMYLTNPAEDTQMGESEYNFTQVKSCLVGKKVFSLDCSAVISEARNFFYGTYKNPSFESRLNGSILYYKKTGKVDEYYSLNEALINLGVKKTGGYSYSDYFSLSQTLDNGIYVSEYMFDTLTSGSQAKFSGDLCVYVVPDSVTGNYQRFLTECQMGNVPDDPDDPDDPEEPEDNSDKLYGVVETNTTESSCSSSDNIAETSEYFNATKEVETITDTVKGDEERVLSKYASLYCLDSDTVYFPNALRSAVTAGTYIIWPTSSSSITSMYNNDYSLSIRTEKNCGIELAGYSATTDTEDDKRYSTYINKDKDILGDIDAAIDVADKSDRIIYNSTYYETYRKNSPSGKDCNSGIFTNSCESDYNAVLSVLRSYGISSISEYDNINNLYNTWNSASSSLETDECIHWKSELPKYQAGCADDGNSQQQEFCDGLAIITGQIATCVTLTESPKDTAYNNYTSATSISISNWSSVVSAVQDKINKYNDCISALNACNSYANKVVEAIDIYNGIVDLYTMSFDANEYIGDWDADLSLSYTDEEFGNNPLTVNNGLVESINPVGETGNSYTEMNYKTDIHSVYKYAKDNLNTLVTYVRDREINMSITASYGISTSYNSYINKETGNTSSTKDYSNYVELNYGILPISYNAKLGVDYTISINNVTYGSPTNTKSVSDYVCTYEVTGTPVNDCICPTGTLHEGEDLYELLVNNNSTCSTVQTTYCNGKDDIPTVVTGKTCPNGTDITACVSAGMTYEDCYNTICTNATIYRCKDENKDGGHMDITSCVQTKIAQGYDVTTATNYCDSLLCSLSGVEIIYRTIDLANPFPGKNANGKILGFNTTLNHGRYPGINWNSTTTVKEKITDNRDVSDNSVYQSEPLYTFELTPSIIKAIREYNDTRVSDGGYADFTLDCKDNNSTACVSAFVHNPTYGITNGTCMNSTSVSNFYECING